MDWRVISALAITAAAGAVSAVAEEGRATDPAGKDSGAASAVSAAPTAAPAAEQKNPADTGAKGTQTFALGVENDVVVGEDKYYTNGIRFAWVSQDLRSYGDTPDLPCWAEPLIEYTPIEEAQDTIYRGSVMFGQNMYTPRDIKIRGPQPNDHPYGGWTYLSLGLQGASERRRDVVEVTFGMTGPASLAEHTQKWFHKLIGSNYPAGWQRQIRNEPGIIVSYRRDWRLWSGKNRDDWGWDVIPTAGASAGNIFTYANAGGRVRAGWNVPTDYGEQVLEPAGVPSTPVSDDDVRVTGKGFSIFVFAGTEGRAVARNIFLDGNTWKNSAHVTREVFVADGLVGLTILVDGVAVTYTQTYRTREFKGQDGAQLFGSLSVGYTW